MKVQLSTHFFENEEMLSGLLDTHAVFDIPSNSTRASHRRLRTETPSTILPIQPLPTMTARQLMRISFDEIMANSGSSEMSRRFAEYLPFFLDIASKETEEVFGYHGATQEVRVFQDALKVIFEEKLGIPIPDDFYFLRIPGDNYFFNTDDVKKEFLESKPRLDLELRSYVLDYFILRHFNKEYDLSLNASDFSPEALEEIERFVVGILKTKDFNSHNPFDLSASTLSPPNILSQEISQLSGVSIDKVHWKLNQLISENSLGGLQFDWYLKEKWDVISMPISQIGEDGWDAFLNRDEKCQKLIGQWSEFCWYFYDANSEGSSKVLSMVGPLFTGFENGGETCLEPFLFNSSYEGHDAKLENLLEKFCQSLPSGRSS